MWIDLKEKILHWKVRELKETGRKLDYMCKFRISFLKCTYDILSDLPVGIHGFFEMIFVMQNFVCRNDFV